MFGIIGLLFISIFGGGFLLWIICFTPSVICLPYYWKFFTVFVVFMGSWLGYEMAGFVCGGNLFSIHLYGASLFAGSMWCMPFFSTYGVSFGPIEVDYKATRDFVSG
jgi:hypothetical protein